jgi:exodeoxyribonuclease V gamma subunit
MVIVISALALAVMSSTLVVPEAMAGGWIDFWGFKPSRISELLSGDPGYRESIGLVALVSALFAEDDERSAAARTLRHTIGQLRELTAQSTYGELISLGTLRRELDAMLVKGTPAVGFLRRGVTLTELIPLRSVPFRVVCLVGMSEDAFPRGDDRLSFDRMREGHRRGDRNKRHDDRHTFLQALLCARDRLIITYSAPAHGQRAAANPSPVVRELVESVDRYYERPGQEHALQTTSHPLHAFDCRYFDGGDFPQSASRRHVEIARALRETAIAREPVVLRADPEEVESSISAAELTRWLWNPTSTFIDRVLRARFGESALYEPTHGLTTIGGLETWGIGSSALQADLQDEGLRAFLAAAPEFPDGTGGKLEREALERQVSAIRERASALAGGRKPSSELLSVRVGDLSLEGRLDGLFEDQRVVTSFTEAERKAELGAWVEHLLMHAADATPRQTRLVSRAKGQGAVVVTFAPANDARSLLEQLVRLYVDSQRSPAPLLEGASRKIVESHDPGDPSKGARAARAELRKLVQRNARLAYVHGRHDPFADADWVEAFRESSMRVYRPLLENRSER